MTDKQAVHEAIEQSTIPFTKIPHSTTLFTDYLYHDDRVLGFYRTGERSYKSLHELSREIAAHKFDRTVVADALERQNRRFGSADQAFKFIDMLRRPETVAVVTGQQAGLFGGPMFTILKALNAIKLAQDLRDQGTPAIPIFWIASEDHDYAEVNHCKIVDNEGKLAEVRYDACWPEGARSVGDIKLCEEIEEQIDNLLSCLPKSEFIDRIAKDLRDSYQVGVGFAEAFARLLARLFASYGVVLLDPQDPDLKRLAARVYEPTLRSAEELARGLVEQSRSLESAGYHAQIHTSADMVPLFVLDDNQRAAMVRDGDCFTLKTNGQCRSLPALLEQMASHPEQFSPSVALRPMVQDFLLPTVTYVGGPSEIAYFGQLRPIYQFFKRTPPFITPRVSMTVVQNRYASLMQKYKLKFEDLFLGLDGVMKKVIEGSLDTETAKLFQETETAFQTQLDKLRDGLSKLDPTLAEALKGSREKIFHQLNGLRSRFISSGAKREETTARQMEKMFTVLYPNKNLQEREISSYYFFARYGYDFIDMLYRSIDFSSRDHKLLYI